MPASTEARHPIGVVAERTGLTPDVLRVWERRYGVVEPERSGGGQRLYSDADIERFALLYRATRGGHGIGHVAGLTRSKLENLVRDIESTTPSPVRTSGVVHLDEIIEQATGFTDALDPAGLERLLRMNVARYGIVTFVDSIAAPFLRRVGDAWHAGELTVSQEHLATAVVQRVVSETAPLLTGAEGNPTIVIGTLQGERHANGALMAAATAASEGWRVIYLGADLPATEIVATAVRTRARAVGISIVLREKITHMLESLREIEKGVDPGTTVLVGGGAASTLRHSASRSSIIFLESMSDMHRELAAIKTQAQAEKRPQRNRSLLPRDHDIPG